MKEAFQLSVGNGDPDEPEAHFTSLFDLMSTPPNMESNDADVVSIDLAVSNSAESLIARGWIQSDTDVVRKYWDPDLVATEH